MPVVPPPPWPCGGTPVQPAHHGKPKHLKGTTGTNLSIPPPDGAEGVNIAGGGGGFVRHFLSWLLTLAKNALAALAPPAGHHAKSIGGRVGGTDSCARLMLLRNPLHLQFDLMLSPRPSSRH